MPDSPRADRPARAQCSDCSALCCRLTVVLAPTDHVAAHLTTTTEAGLTVMARGADGRCVANEQTRCTIYPTRPAACRRFVMDGPYCRAIRDDALIPPRAIALTLC